MTKEVLKQALEALETSMYPQQKQLQAITAIKSALANEALERKAENARELGLDYEPLEAKDEPVGSFMTRLQAIDFLLKMRPQTEPTEKQIIATIDAYSALFGDMIESPASPQRKPLTDEEIVLIVAECAASHQHTDIHFARAIEAKLKEKNT